MALLVAETSAMVLLAIGTSAIALPASQCVGFVLPTVGSLFMVYILINICVCCMFS
jgi:hypothetical protein